MRSYLSYARGTSMASDGLYFFGSNELTGIPASFVDWTVRCKISRVNCLNASLEEQQGGQPWASRVWFWWPFDSRLGKLDECVCAEGLGRCWCPNPGRKSPVPSRWCCECSIFGLCLCCGCEPEELPSTMLFIINEKRRISWIVQ